MHDWICHNSGHLVVTCLCSAIFDNPHNTLFHLIGLLVVLALSHFRPRVVRQTHVPVTEQ